MKETAEVLLKRTRSELVEMAEKLGISTVGVAKTKIAVSIVEARKKAERAAAKEASKPRAEAPKAEMIVKAQPKQRIGTKGVFAKRAAIDAQINENEEAVAAIGTGIREIQKSIHEFEAEIREYKNETTKYIQDFYYG